VPKDLTSLCPTKIAPRVSVIAERSLVPSRLAFRLNGVVTGAIPEVIEVVIITISAVHSVQRLWNCALQVGADGLFLRLSTLSGGRLWHKFGSDNPPPCAVSRNCDSSGESARNLRATLSEVMGVILDAQFSEAEIEDLYASL
jgi:hypothetical protein